MGRAAVWSAVGVLLAAAMLAGCQESGSTPPTSEPPSPEESVEQALQTAFTTADPASCTDRYTARALQQLDPAEKDPLAACEAKESSPEATQAAATASVDITDLTVSGRTATVTVTPQEGDAAPVLSMRLALVEDGGWRIDEITDITILDRASLDAAYSATVQEIGPSLMPPDKVACVDDRILATSDADLEQVLVTGTIQLVVADAIRWCVGGGTDVAALIFLGEHQLMQQGLTRNQARCIVGLAVGVQEGVTLDQVVLTEAGRQVWLDSLATAASVGDGKVCRSA